MPHYDDGREAKLGDIIRTKDCNTGGTLLGLLVRIDPQTGTCNGRVMPLVTLMAGSDEEEKRMLAVPSAPNMNQVAYVTLKECSLLYGLRRDPAKPVPTLEQLADAILCHIASIPEDQRDERRRNVLEVLRATTQTPATSAPTAEPREQHDAEPEPPEPGNA